MKYLLPYENYTLYTRLSEKDILALLQQNVRIKKKRKWFEFPEESILKPYEGWFDGNSFLINRYTHYYGYSLLPVINGVIENQVHIRTVKVEIRMKKAVAIISALWLIVFFLLGIYALSSMPEERSAGIFLENKYKPFLLFLLSLAGIIGTFRYETYKTRKFLSRLLEEYKSV